MTQNVVDKMPKKKRFDNRTADVETVNSEGGPTENMESDSIVMIPHENQREYLLNVQEMFSGQVDPDVVQLVMSECDYNVNEALETLMSITAEGFSMGASETEAREAPATLNQDYGDQDLEIANEAEAQPVEPTTSSCSEKYNRTKLRELGAVPRENNRISFVEAYSSEVYCSNEDLYDEECARRDSASGDKTSDTVDGASTSKSLSHADSAEPRTCADDEDANKMLNTNENQKQLSGFSQRNLNDKCDEINISGECNADISDNFRENTTTTTTQMCKNNIFLVGKNKSRVNSMYEHKPMSFLHKGHKSGPSSNVDVFHKHSVMSSEKCILSDQYWLEQTSVIVNLIESRKPVLVVLRGLPGSGKSTLAEKLKYDGIILSTDDFFMNILKGKLVYDFNPLKLGDAHEWNKQRTERLLLYGKTPLIIDNTNKEVWEMKPYLSLGIKHGYAVFILEPTTPWKFKASELAHRNSHRVSKISIERMLPRYEHRHPDDIIRSTCERLNIDHNKFIKYKPSYSKDLKNPQETVETSSDVSANLCKSYEAVSVASNVTENRKLESECENTRVDVKCNFDDSTCPTSADYRDMNLQDLLVLAKHDSEESVNKEDAKIENSLDLKSWEALTEQDEEFSWDCSTSQRESFRADKSCIQSSSCNDKDSSEEQRYVWGSENAVAHTSWDVISVEETQKHSDFSNETGPSVCDDFGIVSNLDLTNECKNKPKHNSLRKQKQKCAIRFPLLETSFKEKLSSENWVLPKFPSPRVCESSDIVIPKKTVLDAGTMTINADFVILYKVQNNMSNFDSSFSVLIGSSKTDQDICDDLTSLNISNVYAVSLDKSSMTDEFPQLPFEDSLQTLQIVFPTVPLPELQDILEKCGNDHEWATNILLDSGTDFLFDSKQFSNHDDCVSESFTDGGIVKSIPDVVDVIPLDKVTEDDNFDQITNYELESGSSSFNQPLNVCRGNLSLKLDHSFASSLVAMFGPVSADKSPGDMSDQDFMVNVTIDVARKIHSLWKEALSPNSESCKLSSTSFLFNDPNNKKKKHKRNRKNKVVNVQNTSNVYDSCHNNSAKNNSNDVSFREIMDVERAIQLSKHEKMKFRNYDMAVAIKRSCLNELYPGIDENALEDIFEANEFSMEKTVNAIDIAIGADSDRRGHSADLIQVCQQKIQTMMSNEDKSDEFCDEINMPIEKLRDCALKHHQNQQECYRKAQRAKGRGMMSVAAYYSTQGQMEMDKVRKMNKMAAKAILQQKNCDRHNSELDLHGLFVSEAVDAVKKFIAEKRRQLQNSSATKLLLRIITGRGSHSSKGVSKVRKAVMAYLKSVQITFLEVHSGLIQVILTSTGS